jgi:clan AA aspartic protease (TIGR02281 family)
MVAAGITGNITGMRADLIICDDVEVPNTSDTLDKRDELRARLHELSFVKSSNATMLYIGTPHAFDTIYAEHPRDDIADHIPFLQNFKTLRLPIYDDHGLSRWPEKFNVEKINDIHDRVGHARFQSQMMLKPFNINNSYLDPTLVRFYDDSLIYTKEMRQTYLGDEKIISLRAWWDPALSTGKGDKSVIAVIAVDEDGHFYINVEINLVPIRFMIDTGASDIVIAPRDAEAAGFDVTTLNYSRSYRTANGVVKGAPVKLDSMIVGPMTLRDVPASVNGADMDTSLLGMAFLKQFRRYDVNDNTLTFYP